MAENRPDLRFDPDKTITVHAEGAIRLICAQFRSHEDGLPEWVKNSSDAYARLDLSPEESVILLLFRDAGGGAIGCLDFGGMTTADIEAKFRHWPTRMPLAVQTVQGSKGAMAMVENAT